MADLGWVTGWVDGVADRGRGSLLVLSPGRREERAWGAVRVRGEGSLGIFLGISAGGL